MCVWGGGGEDERGGDIGGGGRVGCSNAYFYMMMFLFLHENVPLILTHCTMVDSYTVICWTSLFVIIGVSGLFCSFYSISDGKSC